MRVGQDSKIEWNMELCSISARDWVAKTTLTFFFLNTFSHSLIFAENVELSRKSHASSSIRSEGAAVLNLVSRR